MLKVSVIETLESFAREMVIVFRLDELELPAREELKLEKVFEMLKLETISLA